jgi:hypothetical protein
MGSLVTRDRASTDTNVGTRGKRFASRSVSPHRRQRRCHLLRPSLQPMKQGRAGQRNSSGNLHGPAIFPARTAFVVLDAALREPKRFSGGDLRKPHLFAPGFEFVWCHGNLPIEKEVRYFPSGSNSARSWKPTRTRRPSTSPWRRLRQTCVLLPPLWRIRRPRAATLVEARGNVRQIC